MFSIDKNQNGAANILAKGSIFALILPPFIFYQSFFSFFCSSNFSFIILAR